MGPQRIKRIANRLGKAMNKEAPQNIGPALSTTIVNFLQNMGLHPHDQQGAIDAICEDAKELAARRAIAGPKEPK